jgi:hypothetical protein
MRAPDDQMTPAEREALAYARERIADYLEPAAYFSGEKVTIADRHLEQVASEGEGIAVGLRLAEDLGNIEQKLADLHATARYLHDCALLGLTGASPKPDRLTAALADAERQVAQLCATGDRHLLLALTKVLIEEGAIFPPSLRKWAVANIGAPPPTPRARSYRDHVVCATVREVAKQWPSIRPTRNRARHRTGTPHSACSIVQKALASLGSHLDETAVETIWRHRAVR